MMHDIADLYKQTLVVTGDRGNRTISNSADQKGVTDKSISLTGDSESTFTEEPSEKHPEGYIIAPTSFVPKDHKTS